MSQRDFLCACMNVRLCVFLCERDFLYVCVYETVIVSVHVCRCMVVVAIDKWVGWCSVYNGPVARITVILTSASPLFAAS